MPPKTKRTKFSEHQVHPSQQVSQDAISKQKPQEVFHFVSVNPTSEVQKSHNRTVIRSHASKYIWRQHRAGRTERFGTRKSQFRETAASTLSPLSLTSPRDLSHASPWLPSLDSESAIPNRPGPPEESLKQESECLSAKPQETSDGTNVSSSLTTPIDTVPLSPGLYCPSSVPPGESGTFNQLTSWLADPFHTYPSMLGESTMSKLMRYGE